MRRIVLNLVLTMLSAPIFSAPGVRIDISFAQEILAEDCSDVVANTALIEGDSHVRGMLLHFSKFRDYFTLDNYLIERSAAARCEEAPTDYFRFRAVVQHRQALSDQLNQLENSDVETLGMMMTPYMPDTVKVDAQAVIMIGTPSCGGWSEGQSFYVDFPCINGDLPSLTYLIAHELYHTVQPAFYFDPKEDYKGVRALFYKV